MQAAEALTAWLGIPHEEQPPNYYRLLGVALYARDTSAIRKAYSARLDLLHQKAHDDPEAASVLQHDVRRAAECLIDAASRGRYEEELRRQLGHDPAIPVAAPLAGDGSPAAISPHSQAESPGASPILLVLLGGGLLAFLGALGVGAWWLTRPPAEGVPQQIVQEDPKKPATSSPAEKTTKPSGSTDKKKPVVPAAPRVEDDPFRPVTPAPTPAAPLTPVAPAVPAVIEEEDPFKVIGPAPRVAPPADPVVRPVAPVEPAPTLPTQPQPKPEPAPAAPIKPYPPAPPGTSDVTVGPAGIPEIPKPAPAPPMPPTVSPAPPASPAAPAPSVRELVVAPSLAAAPKGIALPSAIVQGERVVMAWSQPIAGQPELELVPGAAGLPEGQSLQLVPVAGKDPPVWRVNVVGAGAAPLPLAQLTLDDKELRFQWARDIKGLPYDQLANSLVRLKTEGKTHTAALREPVKKPVHTLSLVKKVDTLTFDVGGLPKLDTLHLLMLGDPGQLPVEAKFKKGATFAALGQPVVLELSDVEGAQIEFRLVRKGEQLAVQIAGRVNDPSGDDIELTTERIANLRTGTEAALADAQGDLVRSAKELEAAQYRYAAALDMPATTLTAVQQKRVALETLQGNITVNTRRITSCRKRIPLLQKRLEELPKLERIVQKLHDKAQIPFKIVSALESDEVVLVDGS